jgi:hypothetical protein
MRNNGRVALEGVPPWARNRRAQSLLEMRLLVWFIDAPLTGHAQSRRMLSIHQLGEIV